jgi:hypothetical protein
MSSGPVVTTSLSTAMTKRPAKTVRVCTITTNSPSAIRRTRPFTSERWLRADRRRLQHQAADRVLEVGGRGDGVRGARHGHSRKTTLST